MTFIVRIQQLKQTEIERRQSGKDCIEWIFFMSSGDLKYDKMFYKWKNGKMPTQKHIHRLIHVVLKDLIVFWTGNWERLRKEQEE